MSARFALGIDLGTTNTVVAWASLDGGSEAARVFDVPQWTSAAEVAPRSMLPSVLYAPVAGEQTSDPFGDAPWVLGEYARRRGAEVPGRLVSSSKSWLSHAAVDRTAAILPWGSAADVPRLSPVDAAARLLLHVRRAWDEHHPEAPLDRQELVLTVPASFDEAARELTVEAAGRAGLSPKLLEEPQAAFYDWMARATPRGLAALLDRTGGETVVLVVDVGGGTTDLSLIGVAGVDRVSRLAVGPHLLVGGDNMDLALAHACEPRILEHAGAGADRLDPAAFGQLVAACRVAKETLLGDAPPPSAPVTVLGRGAALLGATWTTRIPREEAEALVLEGFLPLVARDARPQRSRGGLVAFGLPYERDVAITRHIAAFLARHLPAGTHPGAVLLNGGVFRGARLAQRVVDCLDAWSEGKPIERLPEADPDLAVARGAVAYALARLGRGVRIAAGAPHGYFVGIADDVGARRAVCVVPRGTEEGATRVARGRTFALATGRPVRFEVYSSDTVEAVEGDVVALDEERFARLPSLATTIEAPGQPELGVSIEGELSPVGTLDLACVEVAPGPGRRFRLAFQLREPLDDAAARPESSLPPAGPSRRPSAALAPSRLAAALDLVDRAFGKARTDTTSREAKDLLRELDRCLGERAQWTLETSRALFDGLVDQARARRRSADHERVFWLLAGYCVRPGFGDPLDAGRVATLAGLFDERLAFPAEARGWQQYWIAWRRAAGGLDEVTQLKIRDFVDGHLAPAGSGRPRPKKAALSLDDALEMASSLERVPPARREELGGWVLERTWTNRDPRLWSAIGRLGARVPAYASVHHVVAPHIAERWLDHLLREKWPTVPTAAQAAVRLARRTGDRARDIGDAARNEVARRLVAEGVDPEWVAAVREVLAVDEKERATFFGETLPLGLRLVE